jgi:hypothetical protein
MAARPARRPASRFWCCRWTMHRRGPALLPASFELQAGMAAAGMRLPPSTTSPGAGVTVMTQPITAMPTVNDIGPHRPDAPGARLDMPPQVFRYQATARDADGDALSYRLLDGTRRCPASTRPAGLPALGITAGRRAVLPAGSGRRQGQPRRAAVHRAVRQRAAHRHERQAALPCATPGQRNHEFQPGERAKPSQARSAEHGPRRASTGVARNPPAFAGPRLTPSPLAAGVPRRRGPCAEHGSCSPADPDHALR